MSTKQINRMSWFERNPGKSITAIILVLYMIGDFILGWLFILPVTSEYHPYYHHGLKAYQNQIARWGDGEYRLVTNSLGFKDSDNRIVGMIPDRRRILLIGDSFAEGMGYPYERTFAGLIDRELDKSGIEVLNASARSYSPRLYYLKVKYLLEVTGLQFDDLFVFIDISDIQDEIVYETFVSSNRTGVLKALDIFLKNNSFTYRNIGRPAIYYLRTRVADIYPSARNEARVDAEDTAYAAEDFYDNYFDERPKWTTDSNVFTLWGGKGLHLAARNITKLVKLCRAHGIEVTIAVYPWPYQIEARDIDSIQVRFWREYAQSHGLTFLNYFPYFINSADPGDIIKKYYIPGDDHWNARGHRLVARSFLENISFE